MSLVGCGLDVVSNQPLLFILGEAGAYRQLEIRAQILSDFPVTQCWPVPGRRAVRVHCSAQRMRQDWAGRQR